MVGLSGAAATLLLKYGPVAAEHGYNFLNPTIGMLPKVRADAVDALNLVRDGARVPWTAERLFLFFAAFTTMDASKSVSWVRPQSEIVALLLRGVDSVRLSPVADLLSVAMSEVPEMISLVPLTSLKHKETPRLPKFNAWNAIGLLTLSPTALILTAAYVAIGVKNHRDEKLRIAILREIAQSLGQGGLSTIECKAVLLQQGLPEEDALKALQFK
jgi:hypothetical protein